MLLIISHSIVDLGPLIIRAIIAIALISTPNRIIMKFD